MTKIKHTWDNQFMLIYQNFLEELTNWNYHTFREILEENIIDLWDNAEKKIYKKNNKSA